MKYETAACYSGSILGFNVAGLICYLQGIDFFLCIFMSLLLVGIFIAHYAFNGGAE